MAKWTCKTVDIPQNCKLETVATCSTIDSKGSCQGLVLLFFEEMTRCRHQKHHRRWPGNRNSWSKFRRYCIYLPILRLFTSTRFETVAPRLMATAVATDTRHRFSNRWHVANIKNIAGDDQATLMVDRNSANIAYTFWFYIYEVMTVALRLTAMAVAMDSPRRFSKRWHVVDVKNIAGDDQDRSKFCNYQNVCLLDQARALKNILFLLGLHLLWYDCILPFFPTVKTAFVLASEK